MIVSVSHPNICLHWCSIINSTGRLGGVRACSSRSGNNKEECDIVPVKTIPHTRWGSREQPQQECAHPQKCILRSYLRFTDVELKLILSGGVTQVRVTHLWKPGFKPLKFYPYLLSDHMCQTMHRWYILNIRFHYDSAVSDSNTNRFWCIANLV